MKTSYASIVKHWISSIHELHMEADPIAFRQSKQLSRHYHTRKKRLPSSQAPSLLPNFFPCSAWFDPAKASNIRANLCALNPSSSFQSQLTPDDLQCSLIVDALLP